MSKSISEIAEKPISKMSYTELAVMFRETKEERYYTALYNKIRPGFLSYINDKVKDGSEAQDIFANTMVKLYQKIDEYNEQYSVTTWLYRMAFNESLGTLKRKKRNTSLTALNEVGVSVTEDGSGEQATTVTQSYNPDDYSDAEIESEDSFQITQHRIAVDVINNLKPLYRDILVDNLLNGMKYKEIVWKMNPELNDLRLKIESCEDAKEKKRMEKSYEKQYKRALQTVRNRIRRGKMDIKEEVKRRLAGIA